MDVLAHRVAWAIEHGDPGEMCVLHRCDIPRCCNVDHLWLGTHADNRADCVAKGRSSRGESNGNAKLTEPEVLEIRAICALGELTQTQIGAMFCVSKQLVSDIVTRKIWAHISATTT